MQRGWIVRWKTSGQSFPQTFVCARKQAHFPSNAIVPLRSFWFLDSVQALRFQIEFWLFGQIGFLYIEHSKKNILMVGNAKWWAYLVPSNLSQGSSIEWRNFASWVAKHWRYVSSFKEQSTRSSSLNTRESLAVTRSSHYMQVQLFRFIVSGFKTIYSIKDSPDFNS